MNRTLYAILRTDTGEYYDGKEDDEGLPTWTTSPGGVELFQSRDAAKSRTLWVKQRFDAAACELVEVTAAVPDGKEKAIRIRRDALLAMVRELVEEEAAAGHDRRALLTEFGRMLGDDDGAAVGAAGGKKAK